MPGSARFQPVWFRPYAETLPSGERAAWISPVFWDGKRAEAGLLVVTSVAEVQQLAHRASALTEGRQRPLELSLPELDQLGDFVDASRGGGGTREEVTLRYDLDAVPDVLEARLRLNDTDGTVIQRVLRLDQIAPEQPRHR